VLLLAWAKVRGNSDVHFLARVVGAQPVYITVVLKKLSPIPTDVAAFVAVEEDTCFFVLVLQTNDVEPSACGPVADRPT